MRSRWMMGFLMGLATQVQAASLTVSPNPCVVASGQSACTVSVQWDASPSLQSQIWVQADAGAELIFACGNAGLQTAAWIQAGHAYRFVLYDSLDCSLAGRGSALASAIVQGTIPPPTLSIPASASGVVGQSFKLAVNATGATSFSSSNLPPGLRLLTTLGTAIEGIPTQAGTFTSLVSASNSGGTVGQNVVFTIVLPPPPVITSAGSASGSVNTPFSYQTSATNSPTQFDAVGLPQGLSINPLSGLIAGSPVAFGIFPVTLRATNAGGTGQKTLTLGISNLPPVIQSPNSLTGTAGRLVAYQIAATNSPTSYDAVGLPPGLLCDKSRGLISGVVPTEGIWNALIFAGNSAGTVFQPLNVAILPPPPVITGPVTANGVVNAAFAVTMQGTNVGSWSATGLPPGLTLNTISGTISGIPTVPGTYPVLVNTANVSGFASLVLTIQISATALPPTASGQSVLTTMNVPKSIVLTGSDLYNLPLLFSVVTNPVHGVLSGTAPNLVYTPDSSYTGADSFTFKVNNGALDSGPATVGITVSAPVAPTANSQTVTALFNTAKAITLTGNDPGGLPLTYAVVANPPHGTLSGAAPNLTYTPAANYSGSDSFTFKVNNGTMDSAAATVSITVSAPAVPTANPQAVTTAFKTAKAITLTGSDPGGLPLTYFVVASPTHGTLTGIVPNLTYTPASTYSGTDSFTFKVNNGSADSLVATISITISAPAAPTANTQNVTTAYNTAKAITLSGNDPGGLPITYSVVANPAHGTLSGIAPNLTYTPNSGYTGADSFTFKVNNGSSDSPAATVSITVSAPAVPTANPQTVTALFNTAKAITLTGNDPGGLPLTYAVVANPSHGTLSGAAPNLTYTPAAAYSGLDSFTFKVNNGAVDSGPATVSITVSAPAVPTANPQNVTTVFRTAKSITLTGSDPGGLSLTYAVVANPSHGTLSGAAPNLTYTPAANYSGADSFTFKVNNGSADSLAAAINLTISPPPAPTAIALGVATTSNASKAISLTGSDPSGLPLTFTVVSNPLHGALSGSAPNLTYTPASGFSGEDRFTFRVSNGYVESTPATVTITVSGQTVLAAISMGNVTAAPGGLVHVPLTFTHGPVAIASIQFDVIVPPGVSDISGTAGPAATAVGKTAVLGLNGNKLTVIVFSFGNATTIGDGVLVDFAIRLSASAQGLIPLELSGSIGSDPGGRAVTILSSGGSINAVGAGVAAPQLQTPLVLPVNGTLTATARSAAVAFEWNISPLSGLSPQRAALGNAAIPSLNRKIVTHDNTLPLAALNLSPGRYIVTVETIDERDIHSAQETRELTLIATSASSVRVYPNPWRADNPTSQITFDGMVSGSTVKLFTVSGRWVRTLPASNGSATWDLKNDDGDRVASGLYIYLMTDDQGNKTRGKLAIIR